MFSQEIVSIPGVMQHFHISIKLLVCVVFETGHHSREVCSLKDISFVYSTVTVS